MNLLEILEVDIAKAFSPLVDWSVDGKQDESLDNYNVLEGKSVDRCLDINQIARSEARYKKKAKSM